MTGYIWKSPDKHALPLLANVASDEVAHNGSAKRKPGYKESLITFSTYLVASYFFFHLLGQRRLKIPLKSQKVKNPCLRSPCSVGEF